MTIEEFDATAWKPGMRATWKEDEQVYRIGAVDFGEKLLGLRAGNFPDTEDATQWARCENVTIL